jgi:hypothetical protein
LARKKYNKIFFADPRIGYAKTRRKLVVAADTSRKQRKEERASVIGALLDVVFDVAEPLGL